MTAQETAQPAQSVMAQESAIVSLIYKPQAINQNAPRIFSFPANEDVAKALASSKLADNNSQLELDQIVMTPGVVNISYTKWRAAVSHPVIAKKIEQLVNDGALEIITPEIGDVSGLSTDTALTIHYTEAKAKKLIANTFDEEWIRTCMAHENTGINTKGRPEVYNALRQRLDTIVKLKEEKQRGR